MPFLTVIAGCNGAGKSTFAPSFLPAGVVSFDYDKLFLENYSRLPDSELREEFAKYEATIAFERAVAQAMQDHVDFCYETNFDAYPLHWVEKFKGNGYATNLIFFCLETQEIARHRVQVRTEFKGHFVNNAMIDLKWKAGYKNLNIHFPFFDNLLLVDNSTPNDVYTNILQIEKGKLTLMTENIPGYLRHRLPEIYRLIYPNGGSLGS